MKVKEAYGEEFVEEMLAKFEAINRKVVKNKNRAKKQKYFLDRKESAPRGPEEPVPEEEPVGQDHLVELLCKMVWYAPQEWYDIIGGLPRPQGLENKFANIGVAFDASSRLRRAAIDDYHWELTQKLQVDKDAESIFYIQGVQGSKRELMPISELPPKPPGYFRAVCISDTHMLHTMPGSINLPTGGDFLIHSGDLSFEESRSENAQLFDAYKKAGTPCRGPGFAEWCRTENLDIHSSLAWLRDIKGFQYKVLCGGNHDYVLEQMGPANAQELCKSYGITYLHTERAPVDLKLADGTSVFFWGSGVSFDKKIDAGRAVKSGNTAFQIAPDQEAEFCEAQKRRLHPCPDVMLMHAPPSGKLLGKAGKDPDLVTELIEAAQPTLFVCGHAHHPDNALKDIHATLGDRTLGVNAGCCGTWNQRHGYPLVVDLPLPARKEHPPLPVLTSRPTCGGS